jgi:hypothetical protein
MSFCYFSKLLNTGLKNESVFTTMTHARVLYSAATNPLPPLSILSHEVIIWMPWRWIPICNVPVRSLDDAFLGRCLAWTMRPLDNVSLWQCVPLTMPLLDNAFLGRFVPRKMAPLDDASLRHCVPDRCACPNSGFHRGWCRVDVSQTDVFPTENSWLLQPLNKASLGYCAPDQCVPTLDHVKHGTSSVGRYRGLGRPRSASDT